MNQRRIRSLIGLVLLISILMLLFGSVVLADNSAHNSAASPSAVTALQFYKYTMGGSGGSSSGGGQLLRGTLGQWQSAIGLSSGGSYQFYQGFWYGAQRYAAYLPLVLRNY